MRQKQRHEHPGRSIENHSLPDVHKNNHCHSKNSKEHTNDYVANESQRRETHGGNTSHFRAFVRVLLCYLKL
jgi:hypothetical protein